MEQFHEYLYGNTIDVYTDNYLLTYVLTSVKLDATGHHLVAKFANYNFTLGYQSGKTNKDADALSHILREEDNQHIKLTQSMH